MSLLPMATDETRPGKSDQPNDQTDIGRKDSIETTFRTEPG